MADEPQDAKPSFEIPGTVDTKFETDGEWFYHAPPIDFDDAAADDDASREDRLRPIAPNEIDGYRHLLLDKNGNGLRAVQVCSRYTNAYERAEKPYLARAGRIRGTAKRTLFVAQYTDALTGEICVLDWDLTDAKGNAIPINAPGARQLAIDFMTEPRYRRHKEFINIAVATHQGDLERAAEHDQRDLPRPSGDSPSEAD